MTSSHHTHDDDPYKIQSKFEILRILRAIESGGLLLHMEAGQGDTSIVTTILDIDLDNNTIVIDTANKDEQTRSLLQSENAKFETSLDKVKVSFQAPTPEITSFEGQPALAIPIPESIRRLQRREYFRVNVPLSEPAMVTLRLNNQSQSFRLHDISGGGLSLVDSSLDFPQPVGSHHTQSLLELPETGSFLVALQVARSEKQELPNGKHIQRLGCTFIDLPGSTQTAIQNYIARLERQQIAKQRGHG
ncbi:flagellar brake protein [Alcaligenes sp. SDU_A2]|uniref:flagellar brake protein n=1 Tax=Alcaligenes sp. SDU_A2 TaxID=3136634 RepID=UPI002C3E6AAD|nr:flagellar brake protein [Alcaligenes sp.]HRL26657.1 flagellar brake protein [Alcaligenes sp.]